MSKREAHQWTGQEELDFDRLSEDEIASMQPDYISRDEHQRVLELSQYVCGDCNRRAHECVCPDDHEYDSRKEEGEL